MVLATILNEKDGYKVAKSLLSSFRLDKGFQALGGVMKPLLKSLTENAINSKIQGIQMKDIDTIKEQLGALTCSYYALESMIYMTAGLVDIYENQDVEVESAMVQAFAIQAMTDFVVRPLHAVGPQAVIKGQGFERFIRDATQVAAAGEYLDTIQQFISLSGFQHAGPILNEVVKMERNPLNHPAFIFSRVFKQTSIDFPKKKFNLDEYLHPSLISAANFLELSILRFNASVEILLARHGQLVVSHTVENAKIAEAATLCYAMFAVCARASRSYCIGLRNADQEIHLANVFCFEKSDVVKRIAKEIDNGEYATSEHTFKIIGEKLIESKVYHLEHPTTRNF
jgi:acyl-CoA dehydrogenase family member 9